MDAPRCAPPRFATLLEMLAARGRDHADRVAFTFGGGAHTFGALWRDVERCAADLVARGLTAGDRVVLAVPNGPDFFPAFYGVLRAGAVAVPVFAGSGPERVLALAELCGARTVIAAASSAAAVRESAASRGVAVVDAGERAEPSATARLPALDAVAAGDVAFLQYTSGSTGDPKGVQLSHANLLINLEQMIAGMAITARDVFVSWLPVYHDMGLILMTMVPFYLPAPLVLLPTSLANARAWLTAIAEHRGTFTAAPDFAWRLCLAQVKEPARFDLRTLRVALDAAEPVRARTLAEVEAAFGLDGVMVAGYGLAEAAVGVSMWPPGRPPKVDERGFVSVGKPFPQVEVEVVDGGRRCGPGEVGEVVVRSPAATRGYFRNPEATARLLRGDGFLWTGDLGYLDADGDLFIVGRKKNVIIHGGRNVAPGEIEEIVDELPFVRASAAVGVDRGRTEGEQVYLFVEVRPRSWTRAEPARLVVDVVRRFHDRLGFRPGRVYLLRPRAIPKTPNGKLQHALLKARYLDGTLRQDGAILFPEY